MAVKLPSFNEHIDVALRIDDALDMTHEEYDEYLKDPCSDKLKLKPGMTPTLFRMRKVLPYRLTNKVEAAKLSGHGQDVRASLGFVLEEFRCSLIDVINPPDVPEDQRIVYKAHGDGGASEELVTQLKAIGAVEDLYQARENVLDRRKTELDKKK